MIILFATNINAQESYKDLWLEVERLEVNNLPKSAKNKVDNIYTKATAAANTSQIIKALVYQSKFALILEEDAQLKVITNFKKHIANSSFPTKNILENMLAHLYWQYFTKNRYRFYKRTKTSDKVDEVDFRTWDVNTLFTEINTHFKNSLQNNTGLQNIPIQDVAPLINIQRNGLEYQPTLFDFLAGNALDFYKTPENSITKPTAAFSIDNPAYISNSATFATINLQTTDTTSLQFNALKIYQQLIQFHLNSKHTTALAHIDIARINFVANHATFNKVNQHSINNLKKSMAALATHKASGLYAFKLASIYHQQANSIEEDATNTHRFKNKEALALCAKTISTFPESIAATKCSILESKIKQQALNITAEKFVPIQQHSRLLVSYKNIDKLFFTAYPITYEEIEKFYTIYDEGKRIAFIKKLTQAYAWEHNLRNEQDNLQHTTEVIVPKLANGGYLIVATENGSINAKKVYGTSFIQATNHVLIENTFNGENQYQVVNRNTGAPVPNASIVLKNRGYRMKDRIQKKLTTNANGFASFKSDKRYYQVTATVSHANDTAVFGNYYVQPNRTIIADDEEENILIKPFIFTDRSIYRPGQKVYFKAIVVKTEGEKTSVLKNEPVEVVLFDANHQEVKKLELKLNEYGSVAGEFTLPNNGITGEFSIQVDESYEYDSEFYDNTDFDFLYHNSTRFSVEEYKRPKFAGAFNPIKETFRINDTVPVTGTAKAFAGTAITDASVVYRVYRKVQYPAWCYWRMPNLNSSAQEITQGTTTTNAKGEFTINFKALPDESVAKENLPVFTYEVSADITDINGETRSTSTQVKVGYHSLLATINMPNTIARKATTNTLSIDTKNLNGEFVPAKGTVAIYKLVAPENPLRKRAWGAPDYQDISKKTFTKLFPHEPYTNNDDNDRYWEKGEKVFSQKFNTEKDTELQLGNTRKWQTGKYIAVLESKDAFNQKVKDEKRFDVLATDHKQIADNQLFYINTTQNTYQPNDTVVLQIGTASKDMTVVVQLEKEHRIVKTMLVKLNNEIKELTFPVTKEDIGGFAIHYHFVNYNAFKNGTLVIQVPEKQEKLQLATQVFRDKLQPGQPETWSFTVKNDKDNSVTAELLASMYDVSLDEFKDHYWQFNPSSPKPPYYSYNNSSASNAFGNNFFSVRNLYNPYQKYPSISTAHFKLSLIHI